MPGFAKVPGPANAGSWAGPAAFVVGTAPVSKFDRRLDQAAAQGASCKSATRFSVRVARARPNCVRTVSAAAVRLPSHLSSLSPL